MFFIEEIQEILGEKVGRFVSKGSNLGTVVGEQSTYFIKYVPSGETEAFFKEARGLEAIRETGCIGVVRVLGVTAHFLLLEHLEGSGVGDEEFFRDFGTRLARMHRQASSQWGYEEDNFLGPNPQINLNPELLDWPSFFWQKRLLYQCQLGVECGLIDGPLEERILALEPVVMDTLQTTEQPSLLHGDLWSGNYMMDERGKVCLIDPAVYYGHREAELAMCRLFGGFSPHFYQAYEEEFPLPAKASERLPFYQLYHVLNHLNLFRGSYREDACSLITKCYQGAVSH